MTPIPLQQALRHFPNIGPVRETILRNAGFSSWQAIANATADTFPLPALLAQLQNAARENIRAFQENDTDFFIRNLACQDRWRLLHKHWNQCVFLDIETAGLDANADITVISCWDGQTPRLFVKGENLDDFPDYALSMPFLVTFNGATFDIPVIRRYFNIPDLPVPHVDMRWVCHRCNLDGGLKAIEQQLHIRRPDDVVGTNGQEAIDLWDQWTATHAPAPRAKLLRYCAADTIALQHVAAVVLARQANDDRSFALATDEHWRCLDQVVPPVPDCISGATTTPHTHAHSDSAQLRQPSAPPQLAQLQQRLRQFLNNKRSK